MTCIVGLASNGKVWIGGDSAGVRGYEMMVRADEKVFVNGPYVMGFTTSFRMGQILRYANLPTTSSWDVRRFMATEFVASIRKTFAEHGWEAKSHGGEARGGEFLVGYKGQLFRVCSDFQVGCPAHEYDAVGCGMDVALGSMFSTLEKNQESAIVQALQAAERFSAGVRAPFVVVSGGES